MKRLSFDVTVARLLRSLRRGMCEDLSQLWNGYLS